MEIRFALVRFILRQETFGHHDLLHTDYVLGLNQRISALDITRHEETAFRTSGNHARLGWGHVDSLKFCVYPPWAIVPPVHIKFLERDSALPMITQAQTRKDCVWVFTYGSVHDDLGGAVAILMMTMVFLGLPPSGFH